MDSKLYHSRDWGFDTDYATKRHKSEIALTKMQLPHAKTYVIQHSHEDIERVLKSNSSLDYLAIIDYRVKESGELQRVGKFGIRGPEDLYLNMYSIGNNDTIRIESIILIEQMHETYNCFTGIIVSNGRGRLYIEILYDTIDNRKLSCGFSNDYLEHIVFDNYTLVEASNFNLLSVLWSYIKTCLFFKGYYELSFAEIASKRNVYFTYYSSLNVYQNILNNEALYNRFDCQYRLKYLISMMHILT